MRTQPPGAPVHGAPGHAQALLHSKSGCFGRIVSRRSRTAALAVRLASFPSARVRRAKPAAPRPRAPCHLKCTHRRARRARTARAASSGKACGARHICLCQVSARRTARIRWRSKTTWPKCPAALLACNPSVRFVRAPSAPARARARSARHRACLRRPPRARPLRQRFAPLACRGASRPAPQAIVAAICPGCGLGQFRGRQGQLAALAVRPRRKTKTTPTPRASRRHTAASLVAPSDRGSAKGGQLKAQRGVGAFSLPIAAPRPPAPTLRRKAPPPPRHSTRGSAASTWQKCGASSTPAPRRAAQPRAGCHALSGKVGCNIYARAAPRRTTPRRLPHSQRKSGLHHLRPRHVANSPSKCWCLKRQDAQKKWCRNFLDTNVQKAYTYYHG